MLLRWCGVLVGTVFFFFSFLENAAAGTGGELVEATDNTEHLAFGC